jgi:serine protease Do
MPAELVGSDQDTDLAVIKIESDIPLVAAALGDSDALKVGQFAIAVGTPRGLAGSLAFGHITALGRDDLNLPQSFRFKQLIQTDAAINFGNSGGPLCNIDGEIIGINVAIAYDADSIGFAIPINRVKNIVPRLISEGKITRGFLGVRIQDVDELVDIKADMNLDDVLQSLGLPDSRGAHVFQTLPETPASKAGVRNDDIIRKVNGDVIESATDLMTRIADLAPGTTVMLEVWRHREPLELEVVLEEYAGTMELALAGKPILGLRLRPLEPAVAQRLGFDNEQKGLIVVGVEKDSPADKAGIQQGDVILEIAQHEVSTVEEFRAFVDEFGEPGGSILLRVGRQGQQPVPKFVKIPEETQTEEE